MSETSGGAPPISWLARQQTFTRNWLRMGLGIDKAIAFTILAREGGPASPDW